EGVERGLEIGIMVQVDDRDRLPRAVARDLRPRGRRERDRTQAVGGRELGRWIAREQAALIQVFTKRTKSPPAGPPHHRWSLEEFNRGSDLRIGRRTRDPRSREEPREPSLASRLRMLAYIIVRFWMGAGSARTPLFASGARLGSGPTRNFVPAMHR